MGKPTEHEVWTLRSTNLGSGHYGVCELCGSTCAEHFVATKRRAYIREDGQRCLSGGGGIYGHLQCLTNQVGELISEGDLNRDGRVLLLPPYPFEQT